MGGGHTSWWINKCFDTISQKKKQFCLERSSEAKLLLLTSVSSPAGRTAKSGFKQQISIALLYLQANKFPTIDLRTFVATLVLMNV